jgi:hypothetical protein
MDRKRELADKMQIRQWGKLKFHDCVNVLASWDAVILRTDWSQLSSAEQRLRGKNQKGLREHVQAAIFGWLISQSQSIECIQIAPTDTEDHDAIFRWFVPPNTLAYAPIQLKELVPQDVATGGSLQGLIDRLPEKYPNSPQLIVAICHSRANTNGRIEIRIPSKLKIAGLYVFGSCSEDGALQFITGNLIAGGFEVLKIALPGR